MSNVILMQYVGFESNKQGREYNFQARDSAGDIRDFTITISNEAFVSRRVRYQDGPDVCSLRLRRELTANANHPSKTRFLITDIELDDYRFQHTGPSSRILSVPKP